MFQTGIAGITTFSKAIPYTGGCCSLWYTPWQNILAWPGINPVTQVLDAEPSLKPGTNWYGPVAIPRSEIGFKEAQENSKAGAFYKQVVEGYYPGDDPLSRVNLENMAFYRYVVVLKMRAGGMHLLLGSLDSWMDFDSDFTSVYDEASASKIAFSGESISKAFILPSFSPSSYVLPPGPEEGETVVTAGGANDVEYIPFTAVSTVSFAWNASRINRFGTFPLIEVWVMRDGVLTYNPVVSITTDANPPAQTVFNINMVEAETGVIIIK